MGASMARTSNGSRLNLQEAVALLIHNQEAFVREMADINRRHKEVETETKQLIAAIHQRLDGIERTLYELPEAIRQKIGFKTK
jgi:phage host-nuclease inhibitor protein Gam